jgi:hypothetical protein
MLFRAPTRRTHPGDIDVDRRSVLADWATRTLLGDLRAWPLESNSSDLQAAREFFNAESIAPLCRHALKSGHAEALIPAEVQDMLGEATWANAAVELLRADQDTHVIRCLDDIGLRPLVLKGAAYARWLYPENYLRPRCDTDLLFADRESAERAWKCLEKEGYRLRQNVVEGRFISHQKTCEKPGGAGHAIDVHWAISNTHTFVRALPYDHLDQQAQPLTSLHQSARTLGAVHSLIFACLHLFGHERYEHLTRIIWLYDIYLLSGRMTEADWVECSRIAIEGGVAGICRHALDQVGERFPVRGVEIIRQELLEAEPKEVFRPDRLNNNWSYTITDLRALEGWAARIQWIRETILPSPAYIMQKYGKTHDTWLPLLYLHRAGRGFLKQIRLKNRPDRSKR